MSIHVPPRLTSTLRRLAVGWGSKTGRTGLPVCVCGTEVTKGWKFFTCPCCNEQYRLANGINREGVQ